MDNLLKINKAETFKSLKIEYFVTLDGKPVCPAYCDEPGVYDNAVLPLYALLNETYKGRVAIVKVSTYSPVFENGNDEKPES